MRSRVLEETWYVVPTTVDICYNYKLIICWRFFSEMMWNKSLAGCERVGNQSETRWWSAWLWADWPFWARIWWLIWAVWGRGDLVDHSCLQSRFLRSVWPPPPPCCDTDPEGPPHSPYTGSTDGSNRSTNTKRKCAHRRETLEMYCTVIVFYVFILTWWNPYHITLKHEHNGLLPTSKELIYKMGVCEKSFTVTGTEGGFVTLFATGCSVIQGLKGNMVLILRRGC